jgi:hypothetical protein
MFSSNSLELSESLSMGGVVSSRGKSNPKFYVGSLCLDGGLYPYDVISSDEVLLFLWLKKSILGLLPVG